MKKLKLNYRVQEFEMPKRPFLSLGRGSMPSYFIIGAQKAGTTSLQMDLISHPLVKSPRLKELFYFSHASSKQDLKYYQSFFPKLKSGEQTGDATANYFESKVAAERIKHVVPNAKIICLLRNPVDRAYSHYLMSVKLGFETESFETALALEKERIEFGERYEPNLIRQRLGYRAKGRYIDDVKRWRNIFDDSQLLFIKSESYFSNPRKEYDSICAYLGLPSVDLAQFNWAKRKDPTSHLGAKLKEELTSFYAPYNRQLAAELGQEFIW